MMRLIGFACLQITVSFDETTTLEDVDKLLKVFAGGKPVSIVTSFVWWCLQLMIMIRLSKTNV